MIPPGRGLRTVRGGGGGGTGGAAAGRVPGGVPGAAGVLRQGGKALSQSPDPIPVLAEGGGLGPS